MKKALVIVPTYNEIENLPLVVEKVMALQMAGVQIELLIVDDNSPDGTGKLADEYSKRFDRVHVFHREMKEGLGRAYIAGFKWALARDYNYILEMDADLSHDPADVPRLIAACEEADCALGSRYIGGIRVINWPLSRLMLSKGAALYVQIVTGMPFADPTSGFKCFCRRALEALELDEIQSNGYSFQIEVLHRLWRRGFKIVEVPIVFTERREGRSKMSGHIICEAFFMVWRLLLQNRLRRVPRPRIQS
jgi:dolichol-phosphate mannosyltransferase